MRLVPHFGGMSKYPMRRSNPDTFEVSHFKYYEGSNPYLKTSALTFKLKRLPNRNPCPISTYLKEMAQYLPQLISIDPQSYPEMFAQTCAKVSQLEIGLDVDHWDVQSENNEAAIAIQCLDEKTTKAIVLLVWDWLEAITYQEKLDIRGEISRIQRYFSESIYGKPTTYCILQAAYHKAIPTFYLPDEQLFQYGYGKYQVRGKESTFSCDSQTDSDFTRLKDDCKEFLEHFGFPVPKGNIISTLEEAFKTVQDIGYPVAVKPVIGHEGIGVTANVTDDKGLEFAFETAQNALLDGQSRIIVEQSIQGSDFRLLCIGGKFVGVVERKPPFIIGDGKSNIKSLIEQENATEARLDSPTSALSKIITDEVMANYLTEQGLSVESIPPEGETVYLRKVANLSSGGVSIDATRIIHPDNMILAQDIAQYFNLVCMGIDVMAQDISQSWKAGNFSIIEINAEPGIFMHLNPAIGEGIDAPTQILDYLFLPQKPCRIPIITFNQLNRHKIYQIIDHLLLCYPSWNIGVICREGIWINHLEKVLQKDYNTNVKGLLRHPQLDLIIAEYSEEMFQKNGMVYEGSNLIILEDPTPIEMILTRDLMPNGTLILKQGQTISVKNQGFIENYEGSDQQSFSKIYLKEMSRLVRLFHETSD